MGISMKKISRSKPAQLAKCRNNVIRLHRGLLVAHVAGLSSVCLFAMGLAVFQLITK